MKTRLILLSAFVLLAVSSASAAVRYVDANSINSTPPYTNWASAARVIQDAVDAAAPGDELVVTNGVYATGGRAVGTNLLVNRVAVDKPLTISYAWLRQFGLPTDGSADATDPDADGHTTWQEWRCQTCPTNALSGLRLLSATPDGMNVIVRWRSIAGVRYLLERSTDLSAPQPFLPLASGLEGQPGTTRFTDTNAAFLAPLFYRVGVNP